MIIVTVHHQALKKNVSPSQKLNEASVSLLKRSTGEVKKGQGTKVKRKRSVTLKVVSSDERHI